MSYENARANLKEFGEELKLEGIDFDENNSCILGIDDTFSLHITYERFSDRLYLYSPLLDGLPKDEKILLKLCLKLLEGSLLGGRMGGGGVGIALEEELILMHCYLDMGLGTDSKTLSKFAAVFVDLVEKWRSGVVGKIVAGEEPLSYKELQIGQPAEGQGPMPPGGSGGGMPPERYRA